MFAAIQKLDRMIYSTFRVLSVSLLILLFVLMSLNVVLRFLPIFSIGWFDEIVELSFAWMVFVTAAVLWRMRSHPQIDFLEFMLEKTRYRHALLAVVEIINIGFLAIFTYFGFTLVEKAAAWSPIFQISRKVFYIAMPITGAYMTVVSIFFLVGHLKEFKRFQPAQGDAIEPSS